MNITKRTPMAALSLLAIATLGLTACSSGASGEGTTDPAMSSQAPTMTPSPSKDGATMADPAADLVGPGCAAYAEAVPDGAGSVVGMSQDPVAVAASNNPLLTTLVAAVSGQLNPEVNLVDTLNGTELTVFAPVDDAFAKIDAATIESLKTDTEALTAILTTHVVAGQLSPSMVDGELTTLAGGTITVTGSGDAMKVNDANIICGGVHTANATVYLIDSVLMPAM
jgi:uncharacterized surface protein with fasciclin (FAS1) repeats